MMIETDQIDRQFNKETKYKEQTCEKDVDIELDLLYSQTPIVLFNLLFYN